MHNYYAILKLIGIIIVNAMQADTFRKWRKRVGIPQDEAASKLGVTRVTIQNWENEVTSIPTAVKYACEILERRIKQENPNFGPVRLIYSDRPLFVSPYGPYQLPMMSSELYQTNAEALEQVYRLQDSTKFHNSLIVEESGDVLWNSLELQKWLQKKG